MRGPKVTALSVRMPDQSISTEEWATPDGNKWYKKTPFIRGIFNFIESMTCGYQSLMKAAEKAGLDDDEEPSKFEQKLRDMLGDKFMPFLEGCILLFSLVMALFFFAFLPTTIVNLLNGVITHPLALSAAGRFNQDCNPHRLPCSNLQYERYQARIYVSWCRTQDHLLL